MKSAVRVWSIIGIVLVSLCAMMSTVQAADIETILAQGTYLDNDLGELVLYYPEEIGEGQFFSIDVVLIGVSGSFDIVLDGEAQGEPTFIAGDTLDNESYIQATWRERLETTSSYTLRLEQNETTVFSEQFSISASYVGEVISEQTQVTSFTLPDDEGLATVRSLLNENGQEYSLNAFSESLEEGSLIPALKQTSIIQTRYGEEVQTITRTIISLSPEASYGVIDIIEVIPKEVAPTTDDITYGREPTVLAYDPVVLWHLENIDGAQTITYEVEGENQVTGNTVILASQREELKRQITWRAILPLLIIPLIGVLIIFFAKFSPKEKKSNK